MYKGGHHLQCASGRRETRKLWLQAWVVAPLDRDVRDGDNYAWSSSSPSTSSLPSKKPRPDMCVWWNPCDQDVQDDDKYDHIMRCFFGDDKPLLTMDTMMMILSSRKFLRAWVYLGGWVPCNDNRLFLFMALASPCRDSLVIIEIVLIFISFVCFWWITCSDDLGFSFIYQQGVKGA